MEPTNALAALRDIHLPAPLRSWPWAPGWYVLVAIIALMVVYCIFFGYRYYQGGRARRCALRLLDGALLQYQSEGNIQHSTAFISQILKRVALSYFPRATVAGLQGEAWLQFLEASSQGLDFYAVRRELLDMPYQPMAQGNVLLLFHTARSWILQRRGRCLN